VVNDRISEHPLSTMYKSIVHNTILLRLIIQVVKSKGELDDLPTEARVSENS
jgi:hypothetical protein